jgi:hypothetical protein
MPSRGSSSAQYRCDGVLAIRSLPPETHTVVKWESACKPGSVEDKHSSGTRVTASLKRPTRKRAWIGAAARRAGCCFPIWPCSRWGLPCRRMLPPTRCALTAPFHPCRPPFRGLGGLLSVALSVGSRPPGVTWHPIRRSPDFPPRLISKRSVCPADSRVHHIAWGKRAQIKLTVAARPSPAARAHTPRCASPPSTAQQAMRPCQAAAHARAAPPYV